MGTANLFRNRYRVPSARLRGWDYGGGGMYSVTICTQHRICHFGEIGEQGLILSPAGEIVAEEWQATTNLRPYVALDAWVVMPNHFHGILFVQPPSLSGPRRNLGAIIGQFKGACTSRIWAASHRDFAWQTRYWDQIVRDEESLAGLRQYIHDNPARWREDRLHPDAPPLTLTPKRRRKDNP
jgi:REP element-mobilizing transposase RayT